MGDTGDSKPKANNKEKLSDEDKVPSIEPEQIHSLWHGLDEKIREPFLSLKIDSGLGPKGPQGYQLVSQIKSKDQRKTDVVVHLGSLDRIRGDNPLIAWRPLLARSIRKLLVEESRKSEIPSPSTSFISKQKKKDPKTPGSVSTGEDSQRISHAELSAVVDGWQIPEKNPTFSKEQSEIPKSVSVVPPSVIERSSSLPTWSSTPQGKISSTTLSVASSKERNFKSIVNYFFSIFLAPARAAFKTQETKGKAAFLQLWAWRIATILSYCATFFGIIYLLFSIYQWVGSSVEDVSENPQVLSDGLRFGDGIENVRPIDRLEINEETWLIPEGWRVESGRENSLLVLHGPAEAKIEVSEFPENIEQEFHGYARLCAGQREAQIAVGGNGLEYIEVRFIELDEIWHARCIFRGNVMIRASAPLYVFVGENIGEWMLLITLNQQWHEINASLQPNFSTEGDASNQEDVSLDGFPSKESQGSKR